MKPGNRHFVHGANSCREIWEIRGKPNGYSAGFLRGVLLCLNLCNHEKRRLKGTP